MIESSNGFKQRTRAVRADFCASRTCNASYYSRNATLLHNKDRGGRNFGLYSGNAAADGLLEWRDDRRRSDTTVCKATCETGTKHGGNREKRVFERFDKMHNELKTKNRRLRAIGWTDGDANALDRRSQVQTKVDEARTRSGAAGSGNSEECLTGQMQLLQTNCK